MDALKWQQRKDEMLIESSWKLPAGFENYSLLLSIANEVTS